MAARGAKLERKRHDVSDMMKRAARSLGSALALLAALALASLPGLAQERDGSRVELSLSSALTPAEAQADVGDAVLANYRIDTGDLISVAVYDEPDLAVREVRVRGDGTIAVPLIGDVLVRGLTASEVADRVSELLLDGFLKQPDVSVSIDRYRLYYIKGEVNQPGGYSYMEGLTVEKAVALAGGFTERASEEKITLIREARPERPIKSAAPSTPVYPGDILTVGESFF